MTGQEARFLLNYLVPQVENEFRITKKVLAAVPSARQDYRPDPVSRTAFDVAWHIASGDVWFLEGISRGGFPASEEKMPSHIQSVADILAWYEKSLPGLIGQLKALTDEQLRQEIPFFGMMNLPAVAYLSFMLSHTTHHRGQLAAYLRPMGAKVPDIYGGSADEPFQAPA
jgi:uncharacterized damage-inducible protein DinB